MHSRPKPHAVLLAGLLFLVFAASCNFASNGHAAFARSQQAVMRTDHFNVELLRSTKIGSFKTLQSLDCGAQYFHERELTDLTPFGIESGITISQGRPSEHHESEHLFVNGKTYGRNTSSWESASANDDAHPDWGVLSISKDPKEECGSMKRRGSFGYIAYDKVLRSGKVEYLGKQRINDHKCNEYRVTFPDRTYAESTICLGTKDDLPYRVIGDDWSATYGYGAVEKLPDPSANP
jgi:hypothetical protein